MGIAGRCLRFPANGFLVLPLVFLPEAPAAQQTAQAPNKEEGRAAKGNKEGYSRSLDER